MNMTPFKILHDKIQEEISAREVMFNHSLKYESGKTVNPPGEYSKGYLAGLKFALNLLLNYKPTTIEEIINE